MDGKNQNEISKSFDGGVNYTQADYGLADVREEAKVQYGENAPAR